VSEENSAPIWNITPRRRSIASRSIELQVSTSTPKISIVPRPLGDEAEDGAEQHRLAGARGADDAEDLATIGVEVEILDDVVVAEAGGEPAHRQHDLAAAIRRGHEFDHLVRRRVQYIDRCEEDREQAIGDDDHEDRLDHRGRRPPAQRLGAAFNVETLVGCDQSNDESHEWRLNEADHQRAHVDRVAQQQDEALERHVAVDEGDHRAAHRDPNMVRDEGQERQRDDQRDDARHDQRLDRVEADHGQRVEFLAHLHRADLGGVGAARAAGDHDRGEQHAEFAEDQDADEVDDEVLGAEEAELEDALLGDDAADQQRDQRDDRHRLEAGAVEMEDDRGEAEPRRIADRGDEAADDAAEDAERLDDVAGGVRHRPAERLEEGDQRQRPRRRLRRGSRGMLDGGEQPRRVVREADHLHRDAAGGEPGGDAGDQPGAGGVDVTDLRQVEDHRAGRLGGGTRRHPVERFGGVDDPRAARDEARRLAVGDAVEGPADNGVGIGHRPEVSWRSVPASAAGVLEPAAATP
jgi:hypothetical protein